jgi:hypothetical protein
MEKKVVQYLPDSNVKISVSVDESTVISNNPVFVLCLTCTMPSNSSGHTFFWNVIELPATTAASIQEAVLTGLDSHGLTEIHLVDNFIGVGCDRHSIMLGRRNVVAVGLQKIFCNLIIWHCANHRRELAVCDTKNEVQGVSSFHVIFSKLYFIYSMSQKISCNSISVYGLYAKGSVK